jgi:hypothetical protein
LSNRRHGVCFPSPKNHQAVAARFIEQFGSFNRTFSYTARSIKEINMKATASSFDMQEIHRRAAEVRGNWSAIEKRRRMGLPPDPPTKIRHFVLSPRIALWSTK